MAKYKITLKKSVTKDLRKSVTKDLRNIANKDVKRILAKFEELSKNPNFCW